MPTQLACRVSDADERGGAVMAGDLVTWLRDRLDEQRARNEGSGLAAWLTYLDQDGDMLHVRLAIATEGSPDQWRVADDAAPAGWSRVTIIHDERAVRDDIAAKRAIVDLHQHHRDYVTARALNQRSNHGDMTNHGDIVVPGRWRCVVCRPSNGLPPDHGWCQTIRQLGRPYGNQPGYRDEWRPD
jgi:hypothetical protein